MGLFYYVTACFCFYKRLGRCPVQRLKKRPTVETAGLLKICNVKYIKQVGCNSCLHIESITVNSTKAMPAK